MTVRSWLAHGPEVYRTDASCLPPSLSKGPPIACAVPPRAPVGAVGSNQPEHPDPKRTSSLARHTECFADRTRGVEHASLGTRLNDTRQQQVQSGFRKEEGMYAKVLTASLLDGLTASPCVAPTLEPPKRPDPPERR